MQVRTLKLLAVMLTASLLLGSAVSAQTQKARTKTDGRGGDQSVFQLGVGARAISLGSAAVAMPFDASTIYWNPAGLDFLERRSVMLFYSPLIFDTRYHFIGAAYPMLDFGSIGAGWLHYDTGDIKETEAGTAYIFSEDRTASEDMFLLSYAKQLPFSLSIGGSFKFQRQQFVDFSATGYGADLGLLYRPNFDSGILQNLTLGLSVQNLVAPRFKLKEFTESLPYLLRGGMAKSFQVGSRNDAVNLFMTFEREESGDFKPHFGSEYVYQNMAMLRLGYNNGQPNFGGGVVYQMFQIDYAYGKYAEDKAGFIAAQHRVSMTVHFGKSKTQLRKEAQERFIQRMEEETRKKEALNRRNEFEEKMIAGKAYFEQKDYFNAFIKFSQARDLVAGAYDIFTEPVKADVNVWVERAKTKMDEEAQAERERLAKAERESAAAEQLRTFIEDQTRKGMQYLQAGKYSDAIAEWQRGLERDPNNAQLRDLIARTQSEIRNRTAELVKQARVLESQGRIVEAINIYTQLMNQSNLAAAELKAYQDKVAQLQKQLSYEQLFRQGYGEYLNKNYCAAKGFFAQALQVEPTNARLKQYFNDADSRCGAVVKDFANAEVRQRFLEALSLIESEKYDAALRILQEIQQQDRYNKRILDAIDQTRARMQQKSQK